VVRIATWNVNSLKARLPRVLGWLEQERPDILLVQETKLSDEAAPLLDFEMAGYRLAHHGEGRWNGVAIASRVGLEDVRAGFGPGTTEAEEARFVTARCGEVRVASAYAPNGRALGTEFYAAKLDWFDQLLRWLRAEASPGQALVVGGDLNVAPTDDDVWDPAAFVGATHVSLPEREAFAHLLDWGLVDAYRLHHPEGGRYTWWDYRAGCFHKGMGMRIDHLLVTQFLAERCEAAEIDRNARKGPQPSDHAPVWIDANV
jgi:exodeoxyribonuclease-3